jgi:general secretion pathway protein D
MSGMNITSNDEVRFWEALDKEIESVLNRPEDTYVSAVPTMNKNAGLITVTATGKQLARLDAYLETMQKKMHTQVLIDVKMYGVIFNDSKTTGVDWNQIWAFQNGKLAFDTAATSGVASGYPLTPTGGYVTSATGNGKQASVFQLSVGGSINDLVKFLETQGDVYAISNPKIMTLNNQPALITSGTELFYRTINTSTLAGGTTGQQSVSEIINSVFAGVLLDITPEISKDGAITLRINPSLSEPASQVSTDGAVRSMPPDLTRRQISSVVTVQDGGRVILGGLINVKNVDDSSYVPILGDIPILSYLFKREGMVKKTEEIVMIIEPHIVKKEGDNLTLGDLGFTRINNALEKEKFEQSLIIKKEQDTLKEMKEDAK